MHFSKYANEFVNHSLIELEVPFVNIEHQEFNWPNFSSNVKLKKIEFYWWHDKQANTTRIHNSCTVIAWVSNLIIMRKKMFAMVVSRIFSYHTVAHSLCIKKVNEKLVCKDHFIVLLFFVFLYHLQRGYSIHISHFSYLAMPV